jgi:excisionase family DNA binding protein
MPIDQTVLTAQEAAETLGVHVETIRRLARKRDLPSFKIGKDWRFRKDALLQWMENGPQNSHYPCLLVIDDDPSMRKLLRINLESEGYRVITAANGPEGLELVQQAVVHLVLLDLKMPGMKGPEIVAELRKNHPDLPVIIVTGYPDSQMMMEVNAQCPVMLVAKPINKKILLRAVHITLEGTMSQKERVLR